MDSQTQPETGVKKSGLCCNACSSFFSLELLKKIFTLSWPVMMTLLTQFGIMFITYLFCGRLGPLVLAAAALALSFTNVTGFAVAVGLATAFDTLCSQAIGAKQMKQVGVIIQRGLWIMGFACFVVWGLWLNAERIMNALDQDETVTGLAAQMCDILSIGLPSRFVYVTVQKYLQTQGIVRPILYIGLIVNVFHSAMNYVLLFVLDWGIRGAAVCIISSETLFLILLLVYIKWYKVYKETWPGWTQDSLLEWGVFSKVALAGLGMISIEWFAFEVGAFVIGSISKEELGAFAVVMQMAGMLTMIPIGLSLSSSILVGRYLGSGQPDQAIHTAKLCLFLGGCVSLTTVLILFGAKNYIGYAFTDDRKIIELATKAIPVFMVFHVFDASQAIAGGILRGCGLQNYGMVINFIDYNLIGIPLSIVFSLVLKMNNLGMWLGLACGIIMQLLLYLTLLWRSNWTKLSKQARKRAGITSVETLWPPPHVNTTDGMAVARSIANLAELGKSEEVNTEHKKPPESIQLTAIESKDDSERTCSNINETDPLKHNKDVANHSSKTNGTSDHTKVPKVETKHTKNEVMQS